ncbi:hypothetical protein K474DRAFT_1704984 [Panus rudis PR-1116 ss-1]|nr:hypothetical protein K474DRAFT_1704984 [Panus rudis PR-1116 ss-1]
MLSITHTLTNDSGNHSRSSDTMLFNLGTDSVVHLPLDDPEDVPNLVGVQGQVPEAAPDVAEHIPEQPEPVQDLAPLAVERPAPRGRSRRIGPPAEPTCRSSRAKKPPGEF